MKPKILFTVVCVLFAGCSGDKHSQVRNEASAFCDLFSPDVWVTMRAKYQGAQLMEEFMARVDSIIASPEFEAVLDGQHLQPKDADKLYEYYVSEVSGLIGEPYSCPDLKYYFEETLK
ncbi:MAG: hypothetical protein MI864_09575 [Pseudomonadales bacterium]|nr:hypothetical protein [Pseudomonadales bacterium]